MRANLKYLHSPDVDLDTYYPEDPSCFSIYIQAMIGPEGEDSEESFGLELCSPKWLENHKSDDEVTFGSHLVIMNDYNLIAFKKAISSRCDRSFGKDWEEIRLKLGSIGESEFANYQPKK